MAVRDVSACGRDYADQYAVPEYQDDRQGYSAGHEQAGNILLSAAASAAETFRNAGTSGGNGFFGPVHFFSGSPFLHKYPQATQCRITDFSYFCAKLIIDGI